MHSFMKIWKMITHTHTHTLREKVALTLNASQHTDALTHTTVQYNARIKKPLMSTPVYTRPQNWVKGTQSKNIAVTDRAPEGFREQHLRLFMLREKSLGPTKSLFWLIIANKKLKVFAFNFHKRVDKLRLLLVGHFDFHNRKSTINSFKCTVAGPWN